MSSIARMERDGVLSPSPSPLRQGGEREHLTAENAEDAERRGGDHPSPSGRGVPARALAVEVVKLTRAFGPKPVLRGVDLALEQGERLALFGANGAGKTTLLRVLATLARPDAGTARVGGLDVACEADAVRRIVGYVGHRPHIYEELTVRENLRFFARMYGVRDAAGRAEALIARMGLAARAGDRARTLSRGLLQRLALARGIVQEPDVLLLDEPETGLDAQAFGLLRDLVEERAVAGRTTIFTTHAAERGLELASVVAVLARGRITYAGPAAGLDAAALRTILDDSAGTGRGR